MANPDFPDRVDALWRDAHLVTLAGGHGYGVIKDGAIAVTDGRIAWLGPADQLPDDAPRRTAKDHRLDGDWITPGLVDCHTHLVYAGSRVREFEMRLNGATYAQIAAEGGGIVNTVAAVRQADEKQLLGESSLRLAAIQSEGATTIEIKSGYGLDTASELKMLRVIQQLEGCHPVSVQPTFLGAHAVPPEFKGRADAYIDLVVAEMLPAVVAQGIATAVDAFCESIGFTPAQTERVLRAAVDCGLPVKLHAEQLSDLKGAVLAARYGALSVDHLEYLDPSDVDRLAASGCVAVLLPGAFFFLKEKQLPPISALRAAGVPMAVSTDCNPGSSPCLSLPLMMNMACTLFGLTPAEALRGVTINAARALGLQTEIGSLARGKIADLAIWTIETPAEIAYRMGGNACRAIVKNGEMVAPRKEPA